MRSITDVHPDQTTIQAETLRDPTLHRPPPPNLHCSESVEEGSVGSVTFLCTPPPSSALTGNLKFNCRKRSIGVLEKEEAKVDDKDIEEAYETVDPNFFDAGYTLAGATGFQIWAGTRLLLETLTWPPTTSTNSKYVEHPLLTFWREQISAHSPSPPPPQVRSWKPLRVLELGAGIGVVGTNLAAAGAHVLMTDLTTLVENATYPNMLANCNAPGDKNAVMDVPTLCDTPTSMEYSDCPQWLQPLSGVPIGKGWAAATPLDWTQPVSKQLHPHQYQNVDLIVASDCVWLVSMLNALLDTVAYIFQATSSSSSSSKPPTLLLSFQRRDTTEGDTSATFTTINRVIQSVQARGWKMQCLAWRKVFLEAENQVDQDEQHSLSTTEANHPLTADEKEVFVFSISSE